MAREGGFRVLGPLEVVDGNDTLIDVGGPRQRAVLAALLTSPRATVSTESLIDAVWPHALPLRPRRALQSYLARLRHRLGNDLIQRRGDGYAVLVEPEDLDADLLVRATAGEGNPCAALDLWRGAPFQDLAHWPPAQAQSARLVQSRAEAAALCVEHDIRASRFTQAASRARELLIDHRYDERIWSGLIQGLYHSGQQIDALEAARDVRQLLRGELGVDVGPELAALETEVLRRTVALPPPSASVGDHPALPGLLRRYGERFFAGRESELALLAQCWSDVTHTASNRLVLLTGEPGIGKTQLATELARRVAGDGGLVLYGGATVETSSGLSPLIEAVRTQVRSIGMPDVSPRDRAVLARLLPELGDPAPATGDSDVDRADLAASVAGVLSRWAGAKPLLVVLDDLHWAGRSTFSLVTSILRASPSLRMLVVATMRDVPPDTPHQLDELIGDLLRLPMVSTLPVSGLDVPAVAALLGERSDLEPAEVARRSGGSPLYVSYLIACPHTSDHDIEASILARVGRVGAGVAAALRTAAVIGERFPVGLLLEAMPDRAAVVDSLGRAEAARLLDPVDDCGQQLRFRHRVVRSALYDSLSTTERARMHGAVAEAIERRSEPDPGLAAGAIAWHLARAGPFGDGSSRGRPAVAANGRAPEHTAPPMSTTGEQERPGRGRGPGDGSS